MYKKTVKKTIETDEKKVDNKGFIDTAKVKENKKVPGSKSTVVPKDKEKQPPFAKGGAKNAFKKRK